MSTSNKSHHPVNRHKTVNRRRALKALGLGTGLAVAMPERWSTPILNAVILPAHAQCSTCVACTNSVEPILTMSNPGSGSLCGVEFTLYAAMDTPALTITSISNTTLGMGDTLTIVTSLPAAIDTSTGIDMTWNGMADDAPFSCLMPTTDVTITVTATCDGSEDLSQDILLSDIMQL